MKIVAIGGGHISQKKTMPDGSIHQHPVETTEIDEEIIRLSGKDNPKLLFLATASGDSIEYFNNVQQHFGQTLKCKTSWLQLVEKNPSTEEIRSSILNSDIIYVGGGNTNNMLKIWQARGVDKILQEALSRNIVLSGLSAGANCWFKHYCTDSLAIELAAEKGTHLSMADGLGFINGICVPHTITENMRLPYAKEMLLTKYPNDVLYAIDDCAAIVFEKGNIRPLISNIGLKKGAKVRQLSVKNGNLQERDLGEGSNLYSMDFAETR